MLAAARSIGQVVQALGVSEQTFHRCPPTPRGAACGRQDGSSRDGCHAMWGVNRRQSR
jgi:hypothetical protein